MYVSWFKLLIDDLMHKYFPHLYLDIIDIQHCVFAELFLCLFFFLLFCVINYMVQPSYTVNRDRYSQLGYNLFAIRGW